MRKEEARQIIAIWLVSSKGAKGQCGYIEGWFDEEDAEAFRMAIEALSADDEPTVIRSKTLMPTKDFKEWAKRIREENPNAIVIPCDAEVVSANVDLVRCKDCVWYYPHDGIGECAHAGDRKPVPENGYCHNGVDKHE